MFEARSRLSSWQLRTLFVSYGFGNRYTTLIERKIILAYDMPRVSKFSSTKGTIVYLTNVAR